MSTITAKELRNNLDNVLDRVLDGEQITIKHRFKDPVVLSAPQSEALARHQQAKSKALDSARQLRGAVTIPQHLLTGDLKQAYRQHLDEKYGDK